MQRRKVDSFSLNKNNDLLLKARERIIIRWVITLVTSYLLYTSSFEENANKFILVLALLATITYGVVSTVRFLLVQAYKKPIYTNFFLNLDILLVCSVLFIIPEKAIVFHSGILFLIISTGMNYGYKSMYKSNSLVLVMFTFAVISNDYWQENMRETFSVYLMLLLIPFYLTPIIKKIQLNTYSLNEKAHKDYLTGLYNRTTINQKLERVISQTKITNIMSAIFYFDLDNFKKVNDELGHKIGDNLLVAVARNLKKTFRDRDLIFRIGGDEFLVVAEGMWTKEDMEIVADKILETIVISTKQLNISINVTSSIGIVCIKPEEIDNIKDIKSYIATADKAMYLAKKAGKSRYVFAN